METVRPDSLKIYVASNLQNFPAVLDVQAWFAQHGVQPSFDWATQYRDVEMNVAIALSKDYKQDIAEKMYKAVFEADVFLMLMPGKRGAHVEFGLALGYGIPCLIHCPDPEQLISFHHLADFVSPCLTEVKKKALSILGI